MLLVAVNVFGLGVSFDVVVKDTAVDDIEFTLDGAVILAHIGVFDGMQDIIPPGQHMLGVPVRIKVLIKKNSNKVRPQLELLRPRLFDKSRYIN